MYEVIWIAVTQIRLFHAEEIPLNLLQADSAGKTIQTVFGFRTFAPLRPPATPDPMGGISLTHGEIKDGEKSIAIQQLTIESRRIVLNVHSSTQDANKVFAKLIEVIRQIDPRDQKPAFEPIVCTEETVSTIKLGFPITNLFDSSPLREFCQGIGEKVVGNGAKANVIPSAMHFHVSYSDLPESLSSKNILLLPKDVRIELRQQTDPNDRTYFITSPNPTDIHLLLVEYISNHFG